MGTDSWVAPTQAVRTCLSKSLLTYLYMYFCMFSPCINRNMSNKLFWSWSWNENFPLYWPFVLGNSPVFDLRLNKRLSKQSWSRWSETPWRLLWRDSNDCVTLLKVMPCPSWDDFLIPKWFAFPVAVLRRIRTTKTSHHMMTSSNGNISALLAFCTCAQSHALGTRTKFQLEILIRTTISAIRKFQENILESSRKVSETNARLSCPSCPAMHGAWRTWLNSLRPKKYRAC